MSWNTGLLLAVIVFLQAAMATAAEAPYRIAGIELGSNIKQYEDLLEMDTVLPLRHMEYLSEVETKFMAGYKNGYITYGTCEEPGRIVRIKLKYEREDKAFFDTLLEQFKKKFGNASEYKGDVFRAFVAWKWSFTDRNNQRISLILQHNSEDDEAYTSGNSIKISATTLMDQERRCYEEKHPKARDGKVKSSEESQQKIDFKRFLPE